jgi:hypothetical protein
MHLKLLKPLRVKLRSYAPVSRPQSGVPPSGHTSQSKKLGASKEEIAEALGVGITVNAGAALVYSARTLDAFDEEP